MTYDITWDVGYVEFDTDEQGKRHVNQLHFTCKCVDSATGELSSVYGTTDGSDVTRVYTQQALAAIPKTTFINWVHQALGQEEVDRVEAQVTAELDEALNPTPRGFVPE